ncbi:MAG: hypothetical protein JRJ03_08885 [Deltaproteobacteria bacterium]|nr:hypothetical protein [Deltaproteobacteria bacterium]
MGCLQLCWDAKLACAGHDEMLGLVDQEWKWMFCLHKGVPLEQAEQLLA